MLATALLILTTAAAEPSEFHLGAAVGLFVPPDAPAHFTWAGAPRAAWWPSQHWGVLAELAATPGLALEGYDFQAITPRIGASLAPWTQPALTPRVSAGVGLAIHSSSLRLNDIVPPDLEDKHGQAWAGVGGAWRATDQLVARVDLRWNQGFGAEDPHGASTGLEISAGLDVVQALAKKPPPTPVAPLDADGDGISDGADACPDQAGESEHVGCPPPAAIRPDDASIWVAHPHCDHSSAADLVQTLETLDPDQDVVVSAPGYLPAFVVAQELPGLVLEPAPAQGALVVVASPGDHVAVGGIEVTLGADGVALLNVPEGPVRVEVAGGGRRSSGPIAVAQGHATWLRVPPAQPHRALFVLGSSTLSSAESQRLATLAALRGDYGFVLQGGYSPEGDPSANQALAAARADAVHAALVAAGVPDNQLEHQLIAAPTLDGDPELQRSCQVTPIPGGRP